jgi:hypothetical protein
MATPSKMYMISGSLNTATAQTAPFPFDRNTNFPNVVYTIDSTPDGYIAFYIFTNGLYIVSTVKSGMAYGINMSVNMVYKLITYSTTGNPKITTGGVVDPPALYSNATHQMFSIRFNSLKDLYVYSLAPSANPTLLCIPFTTRVNNFTGQTTTSGYVHAIYTFNSLQGVYSFAFQPNTDHIFLCFTNMGYIASLSYSGANDTSKYGLTVKYHSSRVITGANLVSNISTDALSCCFDTNSNFYYTNGTNINIYTANSSGSVVLNYALNNSSFYGPFYISLTGITRSYSIEFDASNNLFVGNINGSLNVIIPNSTTATVFGTVINSYTMGYNSSTKILTPSTYRFYAGGAKTGDNVNISSANSNATVMTFSLDKRTRKSLFFPNGYGVRTVVNLPSPPSYCVVTSQTSPNIQISGLLGTNENNYNSGVPLIYNYYSLDNINYTQVDASVDVVTFSTSVFGQNTVYLKSNNIVGNSSVFSTSVNVVLPNVVGTAPTITSITTTANSFSVNFTPGTGGTPAPSTYFYSLNGGATYTNANSTTSPILISGITTNVTYSVALIATNTAGNTVASNIVVVNTRTVNDPPLSSVCEYYFDDILNNNIKNYKTITYDLSLVNVGVASPTISASTATINTKSTYILSQSTVSTTAYSYYVNNSSVIKNLTTSFSISWWFFLSVSASSVGLMWSLYDPSTNNLITYTQGSTANGGIICVRIGSSSFYVQNASALANQYNHIVFTYNYISATSGLIQVYTNGTLTTFNGSNTSGNRPNTTWSGTNINTLNASPFNGNTILYVHGGPSGTGLTWPANSSSFSNGQICSIGNFTIYNAVLTANEVTYLRNNVVLPVQVYPCFLEGSKILCLNPETDEEEYLPIETLREGDLVKTLMNGYKAIFHIGRKTIPNPADDSDTRNRLYRFPKSSIKGMTEDLCITGEHCTIHKQLTPEFEEKVRVHMGDIYITEYQYRVPACIDERAVPYKGEEPATIRHFALENHNIFHNYGVMANGLLVESCSIQYLTELADMELV